VSLRTSSTGGDLKDHGAVRAAERAAADVLAAEHAAEAQRGGGAQRGHAELLLGVPARGVRRQLPGRKVGGQPLELLLRGAPVVARRRPAPG
jgi:hypothetical protein